jgi:hypothetical protein
LKSNLYLCSFFNVVTKDGISWTATRLSRFNTMKFKLLIEKQRKPRLVLQRRSQNGISWTAKRPGRFNHMKFQLLIEKQSIPLLFLQRRH